jgi:CIC family chloride channel protein
MQVVKHSHRNYYPVEDDQTGDFVGMVHFDDIRSYIFNTIMYDTVFVDQIMDTDVDTVQLDDDLQDVLKRMDIQGLYSMPVISNRRFVGMISKATILDRYRKELMVQTAM